MTSRPHAATARAPFLLRPLRQASGLDPQPWLTPPSAGRIARPSARPSSRAIDLTRTVLQVPADYRIGIVPASDTGAVEMAMWTMLGPKPVEVAAWEAFGKEWVTDALKQLKIDPRIHQTPYGVLPDLAAIDTKRSDVVFTWNGTAAGVKVPNGDWIASDREGLTICDATSAAFAQPLPWDKLDVVTFSWQKVMGGEAAHGMLVLSPAPWPAWRATCRPAAAKIFRLTKDGTLIEGISKGDTISTPPAAVEDYLDTLGRGGADPRSCARSMARADANALVVDDWVGLPPGSRPSLVDPPPIRTPASAS